MKNVLSILMTLIAVLLVGCTANAPAPDSNSENTTSTPSASQETPATETTVETTTPEPETQAIPDPQTHRPPLDADAPVMNPNGPTPVRTSNILFPDGKEILEVGKTYTIQWESEGMEAVDLQLHSFGRYYAPIAEKILAHNGVYEWTPDASLLKGESFVRLTVVMLDSDTGKEHGESDEPFILQAQSDR